MPGAGAPSLAGTEAIDAPGFRGEGDGDRTVDFLHAQQAESVKANARVRFGIDRPRQLRTVQQGVVKAYRADAQKAGRGTRQLKLQAVRESEGGNA
jgi:hypothetical protein